MSPRGAPMKVVRIYPVPGNWLPGVPVLNALIA